MLADTTQTTEILIEKEDLHFSAGHFTIFSDTSRENLHGHNWYVRARLLGVVGEGGLTFDYNVVKSELRRLCEHLDEKALLPTQSPHLTVAEEDTYVVARFADERIPLLSRDLVLVDVRNVSVEELARCMMVELTQSDRIRALPLRSMCIGVSSGPRPLGGSHLAPERLIRRGITIGTQTLIAPNALRSAFARRTRKPDMHKWLYWLADSPQILLNRRSRPQFQR